MRKRLHTTLFLWTLGFSGLSGVGCQEQKSSTPSSEPKPITDELPAEHMMDKWVEVSYIRLPTYEKTRSALDHYQGFQDKEDRLPQLHKFGKDIYFIRHYAADFTFCELATAITSEEKKESRHVTYTLLSPLRLTRNSTRNPLHKDTCARIEKESIQSFPFLPKTGDAQPRSTAFLLINIKNKILRVLPLDPTSKPLPNTSIHFTPVEEGEGPVHVKPSDVIDL